MKCTDFMRANSEGGSSGSLPTLFTEELARDLRADAAALLGVLTRVGHWDPERDAKLAALLDLRRTATSEEKVLVFTQFADTVDYLSDQLAAKGVARLAAATGRHGGPDRNRLALQPSQQRQAEPGHVRLTNCGSCLPTDVLSEGQNLQDCAIVVNYDLPWAIIRLIQRAGRVDRIGQQADTILCYSFLPADGVERIIRLRSRVRQRLQENAEVVGTDEAFFEDEKNDQPFLNLYNEKAGILDGDDDAEVDLASYAYQIWKNAIDRDPTLEKVIPAMPNVVFSTKAHAPTSEQPEGRSGLPADGRRQRRARLGGRARQERDRVAVHDPQGCRVRTRYASPAPARATSRAGCQRREADRRDGDSPSAGSSAGPPGRGSAPTSGSSATPSESRARCSHTPDLRKAIEDIYRYPLRQSAIDTLNRQFRAASATRIWPIW